MLGQSSTISPLTELFVPLLPKPLPPSGAIFDFSRGFSEGHARSFFVGLTVLVIHIFATCCSCVLYVPCVPCVQGQIRIYFHLLKCPMGYKWGGYGIQMGRLIFKWDTYF